MTTDLKVNDTERKIYGQWQRLNCKATKSDNLRVSFYYYHFEEQRDSLAVRTCYTSKQDS